MENEKKIKTPFMERPIIRNIMPFAGFIFIVLLFAVLTKGQLYSMGSLKLLLSQSYVLLISCVGVFMVMTMGGLDFSQGSMLGICSKARSSNACSTSILRSILLTTPTNVPACRLLPSACPRRQPGKARCRLTSTIISIMWRKVTARTYSRKTKKNTAETSASTSPKNDVSVPSIKEGEFLNGREKTLSGLRRRLSDCRREFTRISCSRKGTR